MHLFEFLADLKIRDWERRDRSIPAEPLDLREVSMERTLYDRIVTLVESSLGAPEETRKGALREAGDLEIQLMASLENQGFNLLARQFAEELSAMRKRQ